MKYRFLRDLHRDIFRGDPSGVYPIIPFHLPMPMRSTQNKVYLLNKCLDGIEKEMKEVIKEINDQ